MKKINTSRRLFCGALIALCSLSLRAFSSDSGFVNAADFGFKPDATGLANSAALQKAVDQGGSIVVSKPGVYNVAGTIYVGSNTSLKFGSGVVLKKVAEKGNFTHVILNKGALTKTWDENIVVEGLHIQVNGVDKAFTEVYGLRGHLAFFYVKDLRIERFRCMDLARAQFCIHVCTFEDIIIDDVIIKGQKDGIHLGRGKRFAIRDCTFQTFDDAIALNAHDYATSNPELGWIENGVIENCHDLDQENTVGYFCRILAGAWIDWKPGMEVQQSDTVVANGKLYRVQAQPDGTKYVSKTKPMHEKGAKVVDGINWGVVQNDVTYNAGVRNVVFRDIILYKPRTGFSVHFDNGRYSRSYYPGAPIVKQEQLLFDNIRVAHTKKTSLFSIGTPVDILTIANSCLYDNRITFHGNKAMKDYLRTKLNIYGCVFKHDGEMTLVSNRVEGKKIELKTSNNTVLSDNFKANVDAGNGKITVDSDLPGLF